MIVRLRDFDNGLFGEFQRLEDSVNDLFGRWPWPASIRGGMLRAFPPVNVGATSDRVEVYAFVAGLDPESLDISMQQNVLTIAGKKDLEARDKDAADWHIQERFGGEFRRVLSLPDDVDPEKVEADYHDGVLHISIQRHETAKRRKIEVK